MFSVCITSSEVGPREISGADEEAEQGSTWPSPAAAVGGARRPGGDWFEMWSGGEGNGLGFNSDFGVCLFF